MARSYSSFSEALAKANEPKVKKPKVKKEKGWKSYVRKSLKTRKENYAQAGAVYEFIKDKAPSIVNKSKILRYHNTALLVDKLYDHIVWIENNKEQVDKVLGDTMKRTWKTKPYTELVNRIKILDAVKDIMEETDYDKRMALLAERLFKLNEPNLYTYLYDIASDKTIYRENVENLVSKRQDMNEAILSYAKINNPESVKDEQEYLSSWWKAARKILEETSKLNYESGTVLKALFQFNIWNLDFDNPDNEEVRAFMTKINDLANEITQRETTLRNGFATLEEMHTYEDIHKQMKRSRERERQDKIREKEREMLREELDEDEINRELREIGQELSDPSDMDMERFTYLTDRIKELKQLKWEREQAEGRV